MKRNGSRILVLMLCVSLLLSAPALALDSSPGGSVFVKVSKLVLQPRSADLVLGDPENSSVLLTVIAQPENAVIDMDALEWKSSKPDVAIVSGSGLVTAVSGGSTTVTAYDPQSRKRVNCKIRVYVLPEGLTMNKTEITLQPGRSSSLRAKLSSTRNLRKQDKVITWATSDPNVATVTAKGRVTAVGPGTVTITAVTVNGVQTYCVVTVPAAGD